MTDRVSVSGYGAEVAEFCYPGVFSNGRSSPMLYRAEVYRLVPKKYDPSRMKKVVQHGAPRQMSPERRTKAEAEKDCVNLLKVYEAHLSATGRHLFDDHRAARSK